MWLKAISKCINRLFWRSFQIFLFYICHLVYPSWTWYLLKFCAHFLLCFCKFNSFRHVFKSNVLTEEELMAKQNNQREQIFFNKMFLIWAKTICNFFRRFVCWKARRKQVAIHKKPNQKLLRQSRIYNPVKHQWRKPPAKTANGLNPYQSLLGQLQ